MANLARETLTADSLGLLVNGSYLWIHLNQHLPLLCNLHVPLVYPGLDPSSEGFTDDGVDDVGDVGPRELQDLLLHLWQGSQDRWMSFGVGQHVLNCQLLILRHRDVLYVLALDQGAPATDNVSRCQIVIVS